MHHGCSEAPGIHTPQRDASVCSHAQHSRCDRSFLPRGPHFTLLRCWVGSGRLAAGRWGVHGVEAGRQAVDRQASRGHHDVRFSLAWHPAGRGGTGGAGVTSLGACPPASSASLAWLEATNCKDSPLLGGKLLQNNRALPRLGPHS